MARTLSPASAARPAAQSSASEASAAPAKAPSLPQRLRAEWKAKTVAPIEDAEAAAACDTLMDLHVKNGFFGKRCDGMRRIRPAGVDLEVQLTPNRTKIPIQNNGDADGCGLCVPSFKEERGLAWRDYKVWPNAFPYLPPDKQHLVITSAKHQPQGCSAKLLSDMVDLQRLASGGRQLTLHYNGTAGNSQFHLHWQSTRETLPLQRWLDAGTLPTQDLLVDTLGRVSTYERGAFSGLLVRGAKSFVARQGIEIVRKLDADPLTRGAYNMLLLAPKDGEARLVIVPRRADNLRPEVPSVGRAGIGAFNEGGLAVLPRAEMPETFPEEYLAALKATTVHPSELPWLQHLGSPAKSEALLGVA